MSAVHFDRITAQGKKSGKCPVCDKRVTRAQTFEMTVNPFNLNPDGTVRTPREVREAVRERAVQWEPDFRHEACKEATL